MYIAPREAERGTMMRAVTYFPPLSLCSLLKTGRTRYWQTVIVLGHGYRPVNNRLPVFKREHEVEMVRRERGRSLRDLIQRHVLDFEKIGKGRTFWIHSCPYLVF